MTAVPPVRVVIADDHPMFRFGLKAAITGSDGVDVVGEAADGRELLAVTNQTEPDVVLTDLAMPGLDGAAATILARHPNVAVLVLTMREDNEVLFSALRAGASGYLLKGADRAEIIRAILTVAAGEAVYGAAVARRITDFFTGGQRVYTATAFPELTDRERQVLDLVAAGCGNNDIARRLALAEKTVRNHVSAIRADRAGKTRPMSPISDVKAALRRLTHPRSAPSPGSPKRRPSRRPHVLLQRGLRLSGPAT